jgi:trigger factor
MKVDVEEIEGCKRKIAVEAPADMVRREWERAWGRVQKQARLPGFRKGHVPRSLVKLHFASDVRREVAEHLIPDVYRQAVAHARVDPVNEPDLQDVRLEEGAPLSFTAIVEVKPQIALGDVTGIEVQQARRLVGDADVAEALEAMREQQAQFRAVERAAAPGDLAIVDYTLTPDGEEATSATGYEFIVGGGGVLPEIDQAVAGTEVGAERRVALRFPDDYRVERLRGKPAAVVVKVVELKEKVLPTLDDEFARSVGDFDTLEAVRGAVRARLEARRDAEERRELEETIVDALLERHAFAVPDALVLRQISHQVEHARDRMRQQGVDPERVEWDYRKIVGDLRPAAEKAVRRALLLEAIAEREGIAPTDADVDAELDKIAQAAQRPVPAVRRMMERNGDLEALRHGLRERMTLEFLIRHAAVRS